MNHDWLEELLPRATLSPRLRICWLLFFVLFPAAYIAGIMLEMAEDSPARISGAKDRVASIRVAQQFAATKGFDVAGWRRYVVVETNEDLLAYYASQGKPTMAGVSLLAPARVIEVMFRPADKSNDFRVYLSLTGRVVGYQVGKFRPPARVKTSIGLGNMDVHTSTTETDEENNIPNTAADEEIEALARTALAVDVPLSHFLNLGTPTVKTDDKDPSLKNVVCKAKSPERKEVTFYITVGVRDSKVVSERVEAKVDDDYVKNKLPAKNGFNDVLRFFWGLFISNSVIYAAVRYAKRTLQKEISHVRTLVVSVLFAVSIFTLFYTRVLDELAISVSAKIFTELELPVYAFAVFAFLILGLLVGISYGSGEGEVREAFPGKLTSLDALLAGRIFSRDVAASYLFGAAAAGWFFLVQQAADSFLTTNVVAAQQEVLGYTFARNPWLTLLVGEQYNSILIAIFGLLLPASLLLRSDFKKWRRYGSLILFAMLSVSRDASHNPNVWLAVFSMITLAGALLLTFFAFDFLSALVCVTVLSYTNQLAELTAAFPSWTHFSLSFAILGMVTVSVAALVALRGRRVREEDVRPRYAKYLAERMSLQAEIHAAREAQLRLLPQSAPEMAGLQLAACCLPAHGVGGDFYDFFRLDATRLGIFVAQGSDQGLASALCIALAKGVLMHTSLQPDLPTHTLLELEATIARLREGNEAGVITFAYGIMDTLRNSLTYARLGASPRLVLSRPVAKGAKITTLAPLERVVAVPGRSPDAPQVHEGTAHMQPGDHLILFTKGVTCLRKRRFGAGEYQWLDILMREIERQDATIQTSLLSTLSKYQKNAAADLTAVVVRVEQSQVLAQEVVA